MAEMRRTITAENLATCAWNMRNILLIGVCDPVAHSGPANCATGYSSRSAITGSMLAALRAGHQLANSTVTAKVAVAAAKIRGSDALTPYNRLVICRLY